MASRWSCSRPIPEYVGGISRTVNYKGFHFDIGGHRFFSKSREVEELWTEIGGDLMLERPRSSRIFYRGQFYSYPLKPFEALSKLGMFESMRCMASFAKAKIRPDAESEDLRRLGRQPIWPAAVQHLLQDLHRKSLGHELQRDLRRLGGAAHQGTLAVVSRQERAVAEAQAEGPQPGHQDPDRHLPLSAARSGHDVGALRQHAFANWAAKCSSAAKSLAVASMIAHAALDRHRSQRRRRARSSMMASMSSRRCRSANWSRSFSRSFLPRPRLRRPTGLRYRDFLTVGLILRDKDRFNDNWIYIHDPSVQVGRVQNYKSWSPEMVPDPSFCCYGLEYFCFRRRSAVEFRRCRSDRTWRSKRFSRSVSARPKTWWMAASFASARLIRCMTTPTRACVTTVREALEQHCPNLHLVGRNGMHKYNNQDHAMMTALACGAQHSRWSQRVRCLGGEPGRRISRSGQRRRAAALSRGWCR